VPTRWREACGQEDDGNRVEGTSDTSNFAQVFPPSPSPSLPPSLPTFFPSVLSLPEYALPLYDTATPLLHYWRV
jgi:hypothetical protein